MDLTNIKYAGEAVFLLGVAYRLLRWALGAVEEGDAPPSAYADYGAPVPPIPLPTLSAQPDPPVIGTSSAVGSAVGPTATQVSAVSHVTNGSTPPRVSHLANTLTIPLPPSLLGTLGMLAMQTTERRCSAAPRRSCALSPSDARCNDSRSSEPR